MNNADVATEHAITIHTDGACDPNPGNGGIGILMQQYGISQSTSFHYRHTTNNRMEILAVIHALQILKEHFVHEDVPITLYTDSKYVINTITQNWNRNKNVDLWNRLDALLALYPKLQFKWVKGHHTDTGNIEADRLSVQAMKLTEALIDAGYEK